MWQLLWHDEMKKIKQDDIDISGPKVLRECREVSDKKKKKKH